MDDSVQQKQYTNKQGKSHDRFLPTIRLGSDETSSYKFTPYYTTYIPNLVKIYKDRNTQESKP